MSEIKVKLELSIVELLDRKPVSLSEIQQHADLLRGVIINDALARTKSVGTEEARLVMKKANERAALITVPQACSPEAALSVALEEVIVQDLQKPLGVCSAFPVRGLDAKKKKGYTLFLGPKEALGEANRLLVAEITPLKMAQLSFVDPRVPPHVLTKIEERMRYWQHHLDAGRVGAYVSNLMFLKGLPRFTSGKLMWIGPDPIINTIVPPADELADPKLKHLRPMSVKLAEITGGKVQLTRLHLFSTASAIAKYVEQVRQKLDDELQEILKRLEKTDVESTRKSTYETLVRDLDALLEQTEKFEKELGTSFDTVKSTARDVRDNRVMVALADPSQQLAFG